MTNREKYNFDFFTIENYEKMVKLAIENGFQFIDYKDEFIANRKDILWRHDVEFSPDVALKMAEIESEYGVHSTFFFQLHSEYYNIIEKYFTEILNKIKDLGHNIGLHFDAHYYNVFTEIELEKFIIQDKNYFEQVFNVKLEAFSFHNTNQFILSCEKERYGGLINVYSEFYKTQYNYCADSTGYWRFDVLEDILKDPIIKHLQVLTHDAMWSEKILSPRQRVMKSIQNNAERVKKQYDNFFITNPAKNIDD